MATLLCRIRVSVLHDHGLLRFRVVCSPAPVGSQRLDFSLEHLPSRSIHQLFESCGGLGDTRRSQQQQCQFLGRGRLTCWQVSSALLFPPLILLNHDCRGGSQLSDMNRDTRLALGSEILLVSHKSYKTTQRVCFVYFYLDRNVPSSRPSHVPGSIVQHQAGRITTEKQDRPWTRMMMT